ncbi:MAG: hypothetical protein WD271_03585 [Acidimicrobiia bacterium]
MREDQLEQSLRAAVPRVATNGVLDRVAHKRARRHTVRRIELGAVAFVLVVALSMVVVLAQEDGEVSRVAAPGGASTVRVITGGAAVTPKAGTARTPVPVTLDPDQGYVRGPLVVSGSTLSLAAYDHDRDSFTYPPSRIVRLDDRTFREEGRTDLKAEILSIANGDGGARWVVTRNPAPPNGLPDTFLKRIGADGAVVSTLLPPGTDPVGEVVAGSGAVWIPVRDGVLRYDAATARLTARIDLSPTDTRAVAVGSGVISVTTAGGGVQLLRPDGSGTLKPSGGVADGPVIDLAQDGVGGVLTLGTDGATGQVHVGDQRLPRGFAATSLSAADGRVWVEGTAGGAPAVVLLGGAHGMTTVVLDKGRDASFAWIGPNTVLAVSNGTLLRIDLKK